MSEVTRYERTLLKPTKEIPREHDVVDIELTPEAIYYVVKTNGREFSAKYLGRDRKNRMVFVSSKGMFTWMEDEDIEVIRAQASQ
jgi:hypothetical protein